jgi:hypothetical protein
MSDVFLENLWRDMCGLPEIAFNTEKHNIEELKKTEWSQRFEQLMRNRLVLGVFRGYGKLNAPGKPQWDRPGRIEKEISLYREDGNLERLVDIANMCLLEFEEGKHPKRHFKSSDDGIHTERIS